MKSNNNDPLWGNRNPMPRLQSILFLIATLVLAMILSSSIFIARNQSVPRITLESSNLVRVPFSPASNPSINGSFDEIAKLWSLTEMLNDIRVPYNAASSQPAAHMLMVGTVPAAVDTPSLKRDSLEEYVFQIAAPTPDPTAIALLALGLIFLGIARRKARRR